MKKKSISAILLLAATSLTIGSCSLEKMVTRDNRTDKIQQNPTLTYPVIMDMEVDLTKRVTGTATGLLTYAMNEQYFKQLALAQAITSSNSDLLIEPTFQVTKTYQTSKKITVEIIVYGYAAKYKNPRNLSPADTAIVRFVNENLHKSGITTTSILPNSISKQGVKIGGKKIY
ncbi:MAG: hypothetical protein PHQ74_07555 [Crocinitomicaceae bacterium]|nr:hypothetical protein [Crocinitomicaceae bacterium]